MKVSLSWLSTYVPVEMEAQGLADRLTMAGLEVDSLTDRYAYLSSVVVGRIAAVHPHPQADQLKVCTVETGTVSLPIVCGAPNAAEGIFAPLALPGTRMVDGSILESGKIRGQHSAGMLCSAAELGLGPDGSGIMVLDPALTVGRPLTEALGLSDAVLEFDLTPNRSDCLSILGIAREVAAIQKIRVAYPAIQLPQGSGDINEHASVEILAPSHCPRYAARLLTDIDVGPSPYWLQDRLLSVGLRPINTIVDVTNFVMMETGQPLHAFDFDNLAEHRIVVRLAEAGELFTTLDGKERRLTENMLMICDGLKPVAIGGVMGGLNSEIESSTRRVLIESAYFSPDSIRRTSKTLGLKTEASHRFERGVDPWGTLRALDRASQLMLEVSSGRLVQGAIDAHPAPVEGRRIPVRTAFANRHLGTQLDRKTMADLLRSIEFEVLEADGDELLVEPPSYRVDIQRSVDIVEEVARLSGYDDIPTTFPLIPAEAATPAPQLLLRDDIRRLMNGFGFAEVINYSFVSHLSADRLGLPADDCRRRHVPLLNPLSEEQNVMRTSLLPGLLANLQRNFAQQIRNLRFFEVGKVFMPQDSEVLPREVEMLAGLWSGLRQGMAWNQPEVACDFFDLKGVVEGLLAGLQVTDAVFTALPDGECRCTRPGSSARILVNGTEIGLLGELSAAVLRGHELRQTAFFFEIDLQVLAPLLPAGLAAVPLPKYPSVSRDVTLIVDKSAESRNILALAQDGGEALVEAVHLFDVYEGAPIPEGKKSISFRIVYRSDRETLADEAVNAIHKRISEGLVRHFKADLPG